MRDAVGKPETGTVLVTFALYDAQDSESPLWVESQTVQLDKAGRYSVLLGSTQPAGVPLDLFTSNRAQWLGVQAQIAGETEQPRIMLVGVPYALKAADADTLGGRPASAFLLAPTPSPVSNTAADSSAAAVAQSPLASIHPAVTACTAVASDTTANPNSIALFTAVPCTIGGSDITQNGSTIDVVGMLQLPPTGTASTSQGYNSNPLDLQASTYNTTSAVAQDFQWVAEATGNNTTSPSATLNLLFAPNGGTPAETGLFISSGGLITFASGQSFPGAGHGSVTSVGSGSGLTGGPITGSGTLSIASGGVTNSMLANPSLTVAAGTDLSGGGAVALGSSVTLSLDTTKVPQLAATSNTFTGSISASNFTGGGSGLTSLNPANLSSGTAGINISGNAATATNALNLGGSPPSAFQPAGSYATTHANTFSGNQTVTGNISASGSISGGTATFSGAMQAAGAVIPPLATATTTQSYNSNPLDLQASVYNTSIGGPVSYDLRWQAEPQGNDSTDTGATLNLLYGVPGDMSETGLSVARTGIITFAPGQTFGTAGGITGVTAGTDLTGGGTSGNVTLNLNTTATDARYARLAAANTFTGNQSITGNLAATGTVTGTQLVSSIANGTAPLVVTSSTQVTNLNASLLGGKSATAFPVLAAANTFTGNQSITGNVAATGSVSGSQLVSSIANGTAPLVVTSSTQVTNLNASLLGGKSAAAFPVLAAANTFTGNQSITGNLAATGTVTGSQLVSSIANGTAPLVVTSSTQVANLNASLLGGKSAAAFPVLAASNTFTGNQSITGNLTATGTVTASGTVTGKQLISSVATGTEPLVVTSSTQVTNLNASLLGGKSAATFAGLAGNTFKGVQNITSTTVGATALSVTATDTTSALTTGLVVTNDTKESTATVFKASAPNIGTKGSSCTIFASGNLVCTGTKSAAVALNDGHMAALYAVEAPENWFEDFGSAKLVQGIATVALDPAFAQTVNADVSYHVFVTPKGDCEGLYVSEETAAGFQVRELRGGKSNVEFDYRIVARRKGYESVRMADVSGQLSRPAPQATPAQQATGH